MNKSDLRKTISYIKEQFKNNSDKLKKAALPFVVSAALLFFWLSGENKEKEEIPDTSPQDLMMQEEVAEKTADSEETPDIYVDISGYVKNPGVYQVSQGTRIFQVIEKAGGLTQGADIKSLNRAEEVTDGQKIIIYAEGETEATFESEEEQESKVNINKADSAALQDVPGIGPATAEKIIRYREENGYFRSIEDLLNVSGIGEKTLENMREYITV